MAELQAGQRVELDEILEGSLGLVPKQKGLASDEVGVFELSKLSDAAGQGVEGQLVVSYLSLDNGLGEHAISEVRLVGGIALAGLPRLVRVDPGVFQPWLRANFTELSDCLVRLALVQHAERLDDGSLVSEDTQVRGDPLEALSNPIDVGVVSTSLGDLCFQGRYLVP